MDESKKFWVLVGVLTTAIALNAAISHVSIKQNNESILQNKFRISYLEEYQLQEQQRLTSMMLQIEENSRQTATRVVEALTGLTNVIGDRSSNDQRILRLLEAIHILLNGENHAKQPGTNPGK
jgi:hypothetical protein